MVSPLGHGVPMWLGPLPAKGQLIHHYTYYTNDSFNGIKYFITLQLIMWVLPSGQEKRSLCSKQMIVASVPFPALVDEQSPEDNYLNVALLYSTSTTFCILLLV